MAEIISLVPKLLPLYAIVWAGYIAGRFLKLERNAIAALLIYVIAPVVAFYGVATAPVNNAYLLLPVIFFVVATGLSLLFYRIGTFFWRNGSERNLLSATAGTGNTGYFGLPLVLAITGEQGLSIAIFCLLGGILYESTRHYYILSKSQASAKEAVVKVLKLPIIYAFILGLIVNRLGITMDSSLTTTFGYFKGAYVVLGMMIIGLVMASVRKAHFDMKFTSLAFVAKFLVYPAVMGLLVLLDTRYFGLFSHQVHAVMLLLSIVPMAANTSSYAALLKTHPEKVALAVMASTVFALLYIPVFIKFVLTVAYTVYWAYEYTIRSPERCRKYRTTSAHRTV